MKKLPLIVFFFFLFGMSYGQKKSVDTTLGSIIYGTGVSILTPFTVKQKIKVCG